MWRGGDDGKWRGWREKERGREKGRGWHEGRRGGKSLRRGERKRGSQRHWEIGVWMSECVFQSWEWRRSCKHFSLEAGREEGFPWVCALFKLFVHSELHSLSFLCVGGTGRGYAKWGKSEAGVGVYKPWKRERKKGKLLRRKGTMQVDAVFCGVRLRKMRNYSKSTSSGLTQLRKVMWRIWECACVTVCVFACFFLASNFSLSQK